MTFQLTTYWPHHPAVAAKSCVVLLALFSLGATVAGRTHVGFDLHSFSMNAAGAESFNGFSAKRQPRGNETVQFAILRTDDTLVATPEDTVGSEMVDWLAWASAINDDDVALNATGGSDVDGNSQFGLFLLTQAKPTVEPADLVVELILAVGDVNPNHGIPNSLDTTLAAAFRGFTAENADRRRAIWALEAFIRQVDDLAGRHISEEDADRLIRAAGAILVRVKP